MMQMKDIVNSEVVLDPELDYFCVRDPCKIESSWKKIAGWKISKIRSFK